jgi:hypothetical protein
MSRAAILLAIKVPDVGGTMTVAELVEQWRRRYPRHDRPDAKRSRRRRALRALRALDLVGIALLDEKVGQVTILDIDGLHMVAGNLEVFADHSGLARRPALWPRNPEVPPHLRDLQASLIAAGLVSWKRVGNGFGSGGATGPARRSSITAAHDAHSRSAPNPFVRLVKKLAAKLGRAHAGGV